MSVTVKELQGAFSVAFTTFNEDGSVDYDQYKKQLEYLCRAGSDGIVMYGMTSEYHKLTDAEKEKLTAIFLETLRGSEVISVLSVTDWSTDIAVKTAGKYESMGADALMLMPPFYFKPQLEGVRDHMIQVLETVSIPVILQYAPLATGHYMEERELVDMSVKYPNAAYKIEYRPAVEFLAKFFALKPDLPVLTGWAGLEIIDLYRIGVRGVITVGGFPELYAAIFRSLRGGKIEEARALYDALHPYISGWMNTPETLLAIEKEILRRRGIIRSSYCRKPTYSLTEENSKEIDRFLAEFGSYF